MIRRLIFGVGAGAFGQGTNILMQLVAPSMYLLYWDASTYGAWLMLTALPAYLSMADVGMVAAAGNKMTMAMGRSDLSEANRVYQSAQLFMGLVCGALLLLAIPVVLWMPLPDYVDMDRRVALGALASSVVIALYSGLWEAVFRATGRFALGTLLSQLIRMTEWSGYMLGLLCFRSMAGVAVIGFAGRLGGSLVMAFLARRGAHGLRAGFAKASRAELKETIKPAMSFMAFPLANALSFQGTTLIAGLIAGTASVAVFNTYRTVARVAVQATAVFSHALGPEFSHLAGKSGMSSIGPLFRRSALLGAAQSIFLSALLYFLAPFLLRVWTHGRIDFEPKLLFWLLIYAAIGGAWHVPRILLMSTNRHAGLAGWCLAAGGLSVGLSWVFGKLWNIDGMGAAMLVSELFIAGICLHLSHRSLSYGLAKGSAY